MMMRWNEQPNLPLWGSLPMRVVARDDRAYQQRPSRTTTTSPQTFSSSSTTSVSNGIGVSFAPKYEQKKDVFIEGKKVTQSMYSHHLYKGKNGMMKRDIFGLSLTKKTLGDFGGRRRQMEPRAFVDRFSTLVIQQLFWGTRVYRTSPLKN